MANDSTPSRPTWLPGSVPPFQPLSKLQQAQAVAHLKAMLLAGELRQKDPNDPGAVLLPEPKEPPAP